MSNKSKYKTLWNFFDGHIRCINLVSREDRYKSSKKIFDKYLIPVRYFKAKKHPKGGVYGCFDSHIRVIKEAYYAGAKRVLIFEDDISPTDYMNPNHLKKAIDFMKTNDTWELFYLGAFPNIRTGYSKRTKYDNIYRLRGICAHAYVVNRSAMKRLIDLKYEGMAIDYIYLNYFRSYALYPTLFYQGLHDSDLGYNFWSDYGSPKRLKLFYRCMESYAYYVNYPLIIFLAPVLIVIGWLILLFCNVLDIYESYLYLIGLIILTLFLGFLLCDRY